jgi:5-methylcytosine-specific restriction endonuclease McrA
MNKGLKEKILELFHQGYSYSKISKELNCSKGTISHHLKIFIDERKIKKKSLIKEIESNLPKDRITFDSQYSKLLSHSERRYFYNNFYKRENKGTSREYVPKEYYRNKRFEIKKFLVGHKGGKCEICGYCKSLRALQFHHKDPKEKDFTIGNFLSSNDRTLSELEKCILVCANCHAEIHDNNLRR